ncbi:ATP-binding protein [Nonomuraea sp. NEAU-A123]|uniref:ATP-binding protein n=1 Tax=Nonomuraea sp. NEAU-A123 TaxID=2839649 RepID=UPI001BE42AAF|nr:ATP-binding protein [Nonomuraea sp. NEAU-A123]MBT2227267.1 ATP-binding protein [Nonomuraea sp. NEAU-A123]
MVAVRYAHDDTWVRAENSSAVGTVRRMAVDLAEAAGFDAERTGQTAVAVTEAVSNLVKHAVEGVVMVRSQPVNPAVVELVAIDKGPGMRDVARALRDGYSTSGTLGIGMGAMARISSWYDVHSLPGKGTILVMHFTAADAPSAAPHASGLSRPIGEEAVSGDSFAIAATGGAATPETTVLLCDGLGHGELAAQASRTAVELFLRAADEEPLTTLERLHRGLGHTRGGAVAVARIRATSVSYAGLGNISGWIANAEGRRGMVSVPGIAGHQARHLRQYDFDLPEHSTVVLHSDGLTERWHPSAVPGLFARSPAVVAAGLLREAGSRRDDACVVTVRPGDDRD